MPVTIVKTNGEIKAVYTYMMAHNVKNALRNKQYELEKGTATRNIWWRCTNNKNEHEICNEIKSLNHADNTIECGLSVSEGTHYQVAFGYKYIYPVTGDVCGTGSDGEPCLCNVKALDKPRTKPTAKWLKEANFSTCPEWFTYQSINTMPIEYRDVNANDEVLLGPIYG